MTADKQRRAAVLGGIALFMVAGAIFSRVAPSSSDASVLIGTGWMTTIAFLIGLVLLFRSGFVGLLATVRAGRKNASAFQKTQLSKLMGHAIGLLSLIVLSGALVLAAHLADGRFGWGSKEVAWVVYLAGFLLLAIASLLGTLARFREIEILSPES